MIEIRVIEFRGAHFSEWLDLRNEVLRAPLGLDLADENLEVEASQHHLVGFDDGRLVGGLILAPAGESMKMRQVAVAPFYQRQGLGKRLVHYSEDFARARGVQCITLHARDSAVSFYEGLGYSIEGDPFEEIGIPHRAMRKRL